jgi:hypothetical protein
LRLPHRVWAASDQEWGARDLVASPRGHVDVEKLHVPVEKLADGRTRARVATLVHLVDEPDQNLLGFSLGLGAWWDGLAEVVAFAAERVDACVDLDPKRSARQGLDCSPLAAVRPLLGVRHGASRTTSGAPCGPNNALTCVPSAGFEPATPASGGQCSIP